MISAGSLRFTAWVLEAAKNTRGERVTFVRTGKSFRMSMVMTGTAEVLEAGGTAVAEQWDCAARWNDTLDSKATAKSRLEIDGVAYALASAFRDVSGRHQRAEFEIVRMIR